MPETTPGTTRSSAVAADWALDPADADACGRLARTLCTGGHDQVDSHEWVAGARDAWEDLPLPLRRGVRRFRRHSGPHGTLVIGGLPVDRAALPATPSVPGSVQRRATVPAAVLTMVACGLGEPLAYRAEKSGALVQDVVPVPGQESFHGNAGSVPLSFHTENGFHPHPPDYVVFLCLRADHDRRAGMRVSRHPPSPAAPHPGRPPDPVRTGVHHHAATFLQPRHRGDRARRRAPAGAVGIGRGSRHTDGPTRHHPAHPAGRRGAERIRPCLRGDRPHPAPDAG